MLVRQNFTYNYEILPHIDFNEIDGIKTYFVASNLEGDNDKNYFFESEVTGFKKINKLIIQS